AAPVSSVRPEAFVTQTLRHEGCPQIGDPEEGSRLLRLVGESVPGQTGNDDVESICRVTAVGCRVGQHRKDLGETQEGIGKTVGEEERQGTFAFSSLVDEMKAGTFDLGAEMRQAVDP